MNVLLYLNCDPDSPKVFEAHSCYFHHTQSPLSHFQQILCLKRKFKVKINIRLGWKFDLLYLAWTDPILNFSYLLVQLKDLSIHLYSL